MTKTINGSSTSFVYDGLNPVQEKAGASVTANILPGLWEQKKWGQGPVS